MYVCRMGGQIRQRWISLKRAGVECRRAQRSGLRRTRELRASDDRPKEPKQVRIAKLYARLSNARSAVYVAFEDEVVSIAVEVIAFARRVL